MGLISRVSSRTYRLEMATNEHKIMARPIVHGNTSLYFKAGPRESDKHTHRWTVYLRPYYKNDPILSHHMVKKVQFRLHESIPNHIRTFTEGPPYGDRDWLGRVRYNNQGFLEGYHGKNAADHLPSTQAVLSRFARESGYY